MNNTISTSDDRVQVSIQTELGELNIILFADKAPKTVANFLRYVDQGLFDEAFFYRVVRPEHWTEGREMEIIQGGLGLTPEKMLDPVCHESPTDTGLFNKAGALSMARAEPGTATSDFFICLSDCPCLDPTPSPVPPHDGLGYAVFGEIVEGMELLREIQAMTTLDEAPIEILKGQILAEPVAIRNAQRMTSV